MKYRPSISDCKTVPCSGTSKTWMVTNLNNLKISFPKEILWDKIISIYLNLGKLQQIFFCLGLHTNGVKKMRAIQKTTNCAIKVDYNGASLQQDFWDGRKKCFCGHVREIKYFKYKTGQHWIVDQVNVEVISIPTTRRSDGSLTLLILWAPCINLLTHISL